SIKKRHVAFERVEHLSEQRRQFHRQLDFSSLLLCEQFACENQEATQIVQRNHRSARAHQRVIGIVPLGPLRIHPYAGFRNVVRQLRQNHDKNLFRQISARKLTVTSEQRLPVRSKLRR